MRIFLKLCFVFLSNHFYAQKSFEIKILDSINNTPIENVVVVSANHNETIYFTDFDGKVLLEYGSVEDIFKFSIPGYYPKEIDVQSLLKANQILRLVTKYEELEEITLINKPDKIYSLVTNPKSKKNISVVGNGLSLVSTYIHKKGNHCKLKALELFFDYSNLNKEDSVYVRPLILKKEGFRPLFETTFSILLNIDYYSTIISFKNEIQLENKEEYLIGFQLIDKKYQNKKILIYSGKMKKSTIYMRSPASDNWKQITSDMNSSISFKLFFSGCE